MAREEAKLAWREVPSAVRGRVEQALGSRVGRATRAWGGYAPSVTLRLQLADGRRAFLKASTAESNEIMRTGLRMEERVYRELGETMLKDWAPTLLGAFTEGDWHGLLLEDLGPASVPPWTVGKARRIAEEYGRFHASTLGLEVPEWLPQEQAGLAQGWDTLAADPAMLEGLAGLTGDRVTEAREWVEGALPTLAAAARELAEVSPPFALLHLDTRSDNIRLVDGRLRIFDWPSAAIGPPELDLAAFAQSVPGEGGPAAERFAEWYARQQPVREEVLDACVSSVAAFFALRAWLPPIEGLPRLRGVQRRQLKVSLRWAAARLALPDPVWLQAVSD